MLRDRNRTGVRPGGQKSRTEQRGPSQRQLRVAEELRHRLAELFTRVDFRDPELAGVHLTVAEVRMSSDLQHATVYVARLGSTEIDALMPALARAAPYLRAEAGRGLRLRNIPELHFQPDHTLDYASKVNDILHSPEVRRDLDKKD
ncbi:MAG TPA: 30S ribosome-binding factor RbfA [Acetobacteraceae bacterium]|nr:30S ribosome-binding factor RbfA [Acetobacteraceae bacterium]